jgi:predicted dehydrogenase
MTHVREALRVGVIGVGWGAHVQVPAFRAADGFEPVALCARTLDRVQKAAERLELTDTSTDWKTFIARDDLDVISVATPTALHDEMTLAALEAGKAVLCEKPLATTVETARRLVAAAEKSSRPTACCYENRWNADWLAVAELVRSGFLGETYAARVSRTAAFWHPTHPTQAPWMYDREQGGGYLAGMLIHDLDFICSVLGRPESVCADVRTSETSVTTADGNSIPVTADDTASLVLRMSSGAVVSLNVSVMAAHVDHYRIELFGSGGSIVGDGSLRATEYRVGAAGESGLRALTRADRVPAHPEALPPGLAGQAAADMALMLQDWLPAFEGGPSAAATFEDGLVSLEIIDAAHRSSAGEGWVSVRSAREARSV